jgi:phosphoglycerol transferase
VADRPDVVAARGEVTTARVGWIGRARAETSELTLFALVDGGSSLCAIARARVSASGPSPSALSLPLRPWFLNQPGEPGYVRAVRGLSVVEGFGRWTDSGKVEIEFAGRLPTRFELHLVAGGFGPNVGADVQVTTGSESSRFKMLGDVGSMKSYAISVSNPQGSNVLTIVVPAPTVARDIGIASPDSRSLGLAIQTLEVRALGENRNR